MAKTLKLKGTSYENMRLLISFCARLENGHKHG